METLPSFQSLLDSTTTTAETNASSHHPVGHYPLSDVGSSPFFSSSSSFFSSSSSFFSSSGELSGLLASSTSSSRRGRESPVPPSSPPCLASPSKAPLASFLGSFTMSTTTTTHTTTAPPSAFKPVGHGLAPAPCTLPLGQPLLPGASPVTATAAASAVLPFHASAYSHALSLPQSVPLTSDARAIKKKDCGAHTATAVQAAAAAAGSSGKPAIRVCTMCGTSKTKQWRSGSDGKPSLCNACGLRYRKDSLGQKFKFKQVIIFPSGTTRANSNKKRKALATSDDKSKADSVDEKELTASLAAAKSASKKRRHAAPAAAADQHDTRSREGSPDRRSDIYSLLN